MMRQGDGVLARQMGLNHVVQSPSHHMTGHAHNTHSSNRQHRQCEGIITAVNREARAAGLSQLGDFLSGSAGGFETHHVGAVHQPGN